MSDGYVFHCTPCGKPHAGECPPKPTEHKVDKSLLESIKELAKLLEAGSYNAAPSTLHQCKRNPLDCDVCYPPGSVKFKDIDVKDDTVTISYMYKMHHPIAFIPITFQVT